MSKQLRLPNNTFTIDQEVFTFEWNKLKGPFEDMGFAVMGFDPGLALRDAESFDAKSFEIPVWAAKRIIEALNSNRRKTLAWDEAVKETEALQTRDKEILPIEQTEWARKFALDFPWFYDQAIRIVSSPDFAVRVECSTETGERLWAVIATNTDNFWMESFPTREEAIDFCNEMNWKVVPP